MIPGELREVLEDSRPGDPGAGKAFRISEAFRVSGGSINEAARLETEAHGTCFLKWNRGTGDGMFRAESLGLQKLREAGSGLRIPRTLSFGEAGGTGYLLMEFVEEGGPAEGAAERFGRRLAALHGNTRDTFGLDHDNFIGRLPQSNRSHERWHDFFREERLEPQVRRAVDDGRLSQNTARAFQRLYGKLAGIIPEEPPSLLHGDLWGGNYYWGPDGEAVIYDPAVYYGHREIELAFTRLFGGFPEAFYRAYEEEHPLEPGFDGRVDLHNLYPLLVHTNLFGGSYARRVESMVNRLT